MTIATTTKAERTALILTRERGRPDEFARLHAILCMDHGWDATSSIALMEFFDSVALATRMDKIARGDKPG
jgi:hypothetical protein